MRLNNPVSMSFFSKILWAFSLVQCNLFANSTTVISLVINIFFIRSPMCITQKKTRRANLFAENIYTNFAANIINFLNCNYY